MKRTFLILSLCAATSGWAQENKVYYSHTGENGVQFYSTVDPQNQANLNQPQQSNQSVVKTIEEFNIEELESYMFYCESKLEIAKNNNEEEDVKRYSALKDRCIERLKELSK